MPRQHYHNEPRSREGCLEVPDTCVRHCRVPTNTHTQPTHPHTHTSCSRAGKAEAQGEAKDDQARCEQDHGGGEPLPPVAVEDDELGNENNRVE